MNNKFKIFLSGGITGLSAKECKDWREYISGYFLNYFESKCEVVNPMSHFDPNKETSDSLEKEAMIYDTYHLRTSDIVIVCLNKLDSIGTAQELMLAYELHIPIIGFIEENKKNKIHPWMQTEITKLFTYDKDMYDAIQDAIDYVYNYYLNP